MMLAEVDHVLRLGPRVTSKVDLANGTDYTGIGGEAEDREGWETEAEGCIDGTGVNRGLAEWRRRGQWRRRRGIEESVGAENSRRRIARTGDERARDGGNRGGMKG